jgi:serine/threonine protein kinase/tetratricopeptide (TPR) repeat protein
LVASNRDQLQAAIGASYTIEREIGRGGMATVYLARDMKHERLVALKVLETDLDATLDSERFRREIATVARLQHPHILGVHDSGETPDGQLWFTMPFVEGESLRDRLRRELQLPIDVALRIAREIAGALDYAHDTGIIHRDIKPENILLTKRGDALLADFGIARALSQGSPETGGRDLGLTMTGVAVGTPQYMSPEQAAGERMLDARSDVYALGAVLYEMLAGEPPFTGPSQQAIVAKMLTTDAPSVRVVRPGVSAMLDGVIARALARTPADRWPSADELSRALGAAEQTSLVTSQSAPSAQPATASRTFSFTKKRRAMSVASLALALGFLIGAGLLFAWRSRSTRTASSDSGRTSGTVRLAVLPFDNLGDSADAYFADGMTEAVRGKLTEISGLAVIGSTSSGQYRHTTKTARQIGNELGVRYLLIGKVRWVKGPGGASKVQVSPELVDATTATDTWAQPFNAPITDVFQVQADIAERVAQKLQIALTPAVQQTIADRPTKDVVAYDAYLRAMRALQQGGTTNEILRQAQALFREAAQRDSTFALAVAHLGVTYTDLYSIGAADPTAADSARMISSRALAIAPGLAYAHRARAAYLSAVLNDRPAGLIESQTAVALEPRNPATLRGLASDEMNLGRWDAALGHYKQSLQLDPRSYDSWLALAETQMRLRQLSEAKSSLDHMDAIQPNRIDGNHDRVIVALMEGDLNAAREITSQAIQVGDSAGVIWYWSTYFDLGWMFDSTQGQYLLSLPVSAFDDNRAQWALSRAEQYSTMGDMVRRRIWADTARIEYEAQLRHYPRNAERLVDHALSIAYLGRAEEAVVEAKRAIAMEPVATNASSGPYIEHQLLRIYLITGQNDKAMDMIEHLLSIPYELTPAWMRIDPQFSGLNGNPRFERILAGAKHSS